MFNNVLFLVESSVKNSEVDVYVDKNCDNKYVNSDMCFN